MCPTGSHLMGGATPIPDSYMTASSAFDSTATAPKARLHNSQAWCPGSRTLGMWLQVRVTYHQKYVHTVFYLMEQITDDRQITKDTL